MKRLVTGLGPLLLLAGLAAARPASAEISGLRRLDSGLAGRPTSGASVTTYIFGPSTPEFHYFRAPDTNVSGESAGRSVRVSATAAVFSGPVPEPSAVMLLASGLMLLLWRIRPALR